MPVERLNLPVSDEPRIRRIVKALGRRSLGPDHPGAMGGAGGDERRPAWRASWCARPASTFGRWRQQLHLIVALGELAAGVSVQQVSETLGYEFVTAFITMFKKAFGKPPAKYIASIS